MPLRSLYFTALIFFVVNARAGVPIQMAVTVDDLPAHGTLPPGITRVQIAETFIATFKKYSVPQVYGFVNATKLKDEKDTAPVLDLWTKAGYPLGNHTYSHQDLSKLTVEQFEKEIEMDEPELKKYDGRFDWHYFRFPFLHEGDSLEKRNAIRDYLKSKGYNTAEVTDDFEDWAWNDPYARCLAKKDAKGIEFLKKSYLRVATESLVADLATATAVWHRPIRHVLLVHLGTLDAVMLPSLLQMYKDHGVEFIPLTQALQDPIFQEDPAIATAEGGDFQDLAFRAHGLSATALKLPQAQFPSDALDKICND